MTSPALVNASDVREYMEQTSTVGRWSDSQLGSNIRAATWVLERATGRFFADTTRTLKFTTNGEAYLTIPGLRTESGGVSLNGVTLTVDSGYYLIPDALQTGVYTGLQMRGFQNSSSYGAPWWLSNPQWFDRNLDSPFHPMNRYGPSSAPNDLSVAGSWGYTAANMPEPALYATKVLAAYFTARPDAVLSGARVNPDGSIVDLSQYPIEVQQFISEWRIGPWLG